FLYRSNFHLNVSHGPGFPSMSSKFGAFEFGGLAFSHRKYGLLRIAGFMCGYFNSMGLGKGKLMVAFLQQSPDQLTQNPLFGTEPNLPFYGHISCQFPRIFIHPSTLTSHGNFHIQTNFIPDPNTLLRTDNGINPPLI